MSAWGCRLPKGSSKRITVSFGSMTPPAAARPSVLAAAQKGSTMKILVVDDEPQIRKLLRTGLSAYGYQVITAANGQEALVDTAQQSPDVIILDISLGKAPDGLEVCRSLREWSKDADHHAFGARRRKDQSHRARRRRRRLPDQTVRHRRTAGADSGGAAAHQR